MTTGEEYATHLITIRELTEKVSATYDSQTVEEKNTPPPAWILEISPYAPYVLSFAMFVGVFGIMIMRRVWTLKNVVIALFLALFAAGIPAVLMFVHTDGGQAAKAGPQMQPLNVQISKVSETEADITWATQEATLGLVRYSEAPFDTLAARMIYANDQQPVTAHHARLSALEKDHAYELEILSGDMWYDNAGKPIRFVFK